MKNILFLAMGLISYQSFAVIGDTPYTQAQNLKAELNCPKEAAYVTGTTELQGGVDPNTLGVITKNSNTNIISCAAKSAQTDPKICIDLVAADTPGFSIPPAYLIDRDAVRALLIDKKYQTIPFDACVQKLFTGNMAGQFGINYSTLNTPLIIRVLGGTELVHRD